MRIHLLAFAPPMVVPCAKVTINKTITIGSIKTDPPEK